MDISAIKNSFGQIEETKTPSQNQQSHRRNMLEEQRDPGCPAASH